MLLFLIGIGNTEAVLLLGTMVLLGIATFRLAKWLLRRFLPGASEKNIVNIARACAVLGSLLPIFLLTALILLSL